jgi:hypothetical protein
MSVTFSPDGDFRVPCEACGGKVLTIAEQFSDMETCEECYGAGTIDACESVNMANGSAARVLSALGYDEEDFECGGALASELLARVRTVRNIGAVTSDYRCEVVPGGPTIHHSGYSADRIMGHLSAIARVCEWAIAREIEKVWWG